ncbi:type II toxin-antitoxin system ParD family antitoxin [Cronbergia sp. UHCC 0137]|uniref:type II toxin-antitoxin system ParD family antitoxin n=1 Tax=Cronbergia sp. UHCC 0137 TaxID=3110239 RepID=UPI002B1F386E|nr:type II toxin-antitoxin system ParD family antitoxin [Cronbergia sp. UHCC 0137]MEA5619343.1 type II toxin-antitoxin system ParD family antitoxin [Cronbergia sp. UHCC 0137]
MNVHLGQTFDQFVAELLDSGLYQSQSEVIREGLRLLKEREDLRKLRLQELRKEVQIGIDQLDRGETVAFDPEKIKAEGRKRQGAKHSS